MPKKPAKETFSREEVHEILRRNVELYRNDPGFVEYFVELTLYFVGKSGLGDTLTPEQTPLPVDYLKRPDPKPAPLSPPPAKEEPEVAGPADEDTPSSRRFAKPPIVPPSAPPPASLDEVAVPPNMKREQTPPPFHPSKEPPGVNVERAPLQTPTPGEPRPAGETSSRRMIPGLQSGAPRGEDPPPMKKPPLTGRTQVYRVVRPYKSPTSMEVPCKSCGTMMPHEAQYCPGCGEPRTR